MGCTSSLPKTSKFISEDILEEVVGSYRDAPPAHFIYKIDNFSCLTDPYNIYSFVQQLETTGFEVGGYKWKLSIYPNGDMNKNVKDHISVYLEICETSSMPVGWEVNVVFRFFLLDQIRDKYLMLGDPSNGYLMDDKCVFGAEVLLVPRSTGCGEHLTMVKTRSTTMRDWRIQNFSHLNEEFIYSGAFIVGGFTWNVKIYPKGEDGRNKSISLYLSLADSTNFTHTVKVYTEFKLRLKDQIPGVTIISGNVHKANHWFCASSKECGWEKFKEVDFFTNKEYGYLVDDSIVIGVEITVLAVVQKLP